MSHLPKAQWHCQPGVGTAATLPCPEKLRGHVPDPNFLAPGISIQIELTSPDHHEAGEPNQEPPSPHPTLPSHASQGNSPAPGLPTVAGTWMKLTPGNENLETVSSSPPTL